MSGLLDVDEILSGMILRRLRLAKWAREISIIIKCNMIVTPSLGHKQKLVKQNYGAYPGQEQQNGH